MTSHTFAFWRRLGPVVAISVVLGSVVALRAQDDASAWMRMSRSTLAVVVDLASETPAEAVSRRDQALDRLHEQLRRADAEEVFAATAMPLDRDAGFDALVAAASTASVDYLAAMQQSFARQRAADAAGSHEWIDKQMTAARRYAALAAAALARQAGSDEAEVARLGKEPFAVRRPLERAVAFKKQLVRDGFSPEHRRLLETGGLDANQIAAYQKEVFATAANQLGTSIVEAYEGIAQLRRARAAALELFATEGPTNAEALSRTFALGNPHDRPEVIDVVVRRAAMPPDWQVSLNGVVELADKRISRLQEVSAGAHYRIALPARHEVTITCVVRPDGPPAENTIARWAIEGRIGSDLIGGIVHEWRVPALVSDLELPPVLSGDGATPAGSSWRVLAAGIGGGLLLLATALAVMRARRRNA
jgi:hypothetical protein